ncbi:hypothetical protein DAI22_03g201400 [Oryza sativa Japonica Group]|nr:hypothetical protein DAI22_03g201400 [Oryza sativa Japonica Group]
MAHLSAHHTRTQTISNKQSGWYSSGGGGGGGGRRRRAERRREEARERTMEAAAAVTRLSFVPLAAAARPLLAGFMRPRVFASISSSSSSSPFSGGGGGHFFGGGGGRGRGGGGGGGGEEYGAGAAAAASAAAAVVLGETETADADVILLRVGGMSCGGCAASVKRILESQPEVTSATVDFEKKTAAVWTTPEAKATKDWRKQLGEKLSHHLSTCGFQSHLLDEEEPDSGSQQ